MWVWGGFGACEKKKGRFRRTGGPARLFYGRRRLARCSENGDRRNERPRHSRRSRSRRAVSVVAGSGVVFGFERVRLERRRIESERESASERASGVKREPRGTHELARQVRRHGGSGEPVGADRGLGARGRAAGGGLSSVIYFFCGAGRGRLGDRRAAGGQRDGEEGEGEGGENRKRGLARAAPAPPFSRSGRETALGPRDARPGMREAARIVPVQACGALFVSRPRERERVLTLSQSLASRARQSRCHMRPGIERVRMNLTQQSGAAPWPRTSVSVAKQGARKRFCCVLPSFRPVLLALCARTYLRGGRLEQHRHLGKKIEVELGRNRGLGRRDKPEEARRGEDDGGATSRAARAPPSKSENDFPSALPCTIAHTPQTRPVPITSNHMLRASLSLSRASSPLRRCCPSSLSPGAGVTPRPSSLRPRRGISTPTARAMASDEEKAAAAAAP